MEMRNSTIRIFCYICLLCMNILTVLGYGSAYAVTATTDDFVGVWEGSGTYISTTESFAGPLTINLSSSGNLLTGFYRFRNGAPEKISGPVTNGIFTFNLPNSNPSDPDCAKWNVTGMGTLNENMLTMNFTLDGIFCGLNGGQPGHFSATVVKQVSNIPPYKPTLISPINGASDISLTPRFQTSIFSDPNSGDTHFKTEWQISIGGDFSSTVLNVISTVHLTTMTVPHLALTERTTYYWRVRFYDNHSRVSQWSNTFSFSTLTLGNDRNGNGIPDSQENDTVDLNEDGTPDAQQDFIKSLNTIGGNGQTGVSIQSALTVTSIERIESIDPETISENAHPANMTLDLLAFTLNVVNKGDLAHVTVYFSEAAPVNAKWYIYDSIKGWMDYSEYAIFSADRKSVLLEVKDGGHGDSDGLQNRIIVDPGGYGLASWINGMVSDSSTRQPIHKAVINISNLEINTLPDGHYLSMISAGTFSISASAKCYESSGNSNVVIPEGGVITRDFALEKSVDSDRDGIPNSCDAFPDDINEWLDTDEDGTGNHSDPDDDNDGMPDEWELKYTLNPFVDDATDDPDADGWSNIMEYEGDTDPTDPNSHPSKAMPWMPMILLDD